MGLLNLVEELIAPILNNHCRTTPLSRIHTIFVFLFKDLKAAGGSLPHKQINFAYSRMLLHC